MVENELTWVLECLIFSLLFRLVSEGFSVRGYPCYNDMCVYKIPPYLQSIVSFRKPSSILLNFLFECIKCFSVSSFPGLYSTSHYKNIIKSMFMTFLGK